MAIKQILRKLENYLSNLPGVKGIEIYGSIQDGKADKYSDIDLTIRSDNPIGTMSNLTETLHKIGNTYVVVPISLSKKERVYTIVWTNYSLYQKMDLKINFASPLPINSYQIPFNENLRIFYDFFIGAIRYTKYRKRKMPWAAYKFFRAAIDMWVELQSKTVTLDDFIKLDGLKKSLQIRWIYPKNASEMNRIMIKISTEFLRLSLKIKGVKMASNEGKFGKEVIKFMRGELHT